MTIGRSQMNKQIRGYNQGGGIADLDAFDSDGSVSASAEYDTKLKEIMDLMSAKSPSAPSQKNIKAYEDQLRNIYGQRKKRNFYDMASTVGSAMLRADPTAGTFRSLGLGLAEYDQQEQKLRSQERAEDRSWRKAVRQDVAGRLEDGKGTKHSWSISQGDW